jgi:hypothetical protein
MAEIELGTIGSPEITLILNGSNNLEFQDSNGNVITTFKQDQSAEFDSVSTDDLGITAPSLGSTKILLDAFDADGVGGGLITQPTDGVDTSATNILVFPEELQSALVTVWGDQGGGDRFSDILNWNRATGTSTISSVENGSPATRSYSRGSDNWKLALEMGSGTADVAATALIAQR